MSTEQQAVRSSVSRLFQTTGPDTEKSCVPSAVDVLAVKVFQNWRTEAAVCQLRIRMAYRHLRDRRVPCSYLLTGIHCP